MLIENLYILLLCHFYTLRFVEKNIMILNEITRNIYIKLTLDNGSILEGTNTLADFVDSI